MFLAHIHKVHNVGWNVAITKIQKKYLNALKYLKIGANKFNQTLAKVNYLLTNQCKNNNLSKMVPE